MCSGARCLVAWLARRWPTLSAMGSVMIPLMKREGYDADYAVNVTTHAALVGALMPTSHNLIIYVLATAGIAAVSVFQPHPGLFAARALPDAGQPRRGLRGGARSAATPTQGLPRLGPVFTRRWRRCRAARDRHHPRRHPQRRLHRHRVGRHGCVLGLDRHRHCLPLLELAGAFWPPAPRPARPPAWCCCSSASPRPLATSWRSMRCRRRRGDWLQQLSGNQSWLIFLWVNVLLFFARHLPRHGRDHPDLHAHLLAHLHEGRHGPHAVRRGDVAQLRAGAQHPPVGSTQFVAARLAVCRSGR